MADGGDDDDGPYVYWASEIRFYIFRWDEMRCVCVCVIRSFFRFYCVNSCWLRTASASLQRFSKS